MVDDPKEDPAASLNSNAVSLCGSGQTIIVKRPTRGSDRRTLEEVSVLFG